MCSSKCAHCTKKASQKNKVTLVEAPHKRSMCETKMRYDVMFNGELKGELYFNLTGYVGYLPQCDCGSISIGERPISEYRREVARINRGQ